MEPLEHVLTTLIKNNIVINKQPITQLQHLQSLLLPGS